MYGKLTLRVEAVHDALLTWRVCFYFRVLCCAVLCRHGKILVLALGIGNLQYCWGPRPEPTSPSHYLRLYLYNAYVQQHTALAPFQRDMLGSSRLDRQTESKQLNANQAKAAQYSYWTNAEIRCTIVAHCHSLIGFWLHSLLCRTLRMRHDSSRYKNTVKLDSQAHPLNAPNYMRYSNDANWTLSSRNIIKGVFHWMIKSRACCSQFNILDGPVSRTLRYLWTCHYTLLRQLNKHWI